VSEIPADLRTKLEDRIREQIACEARGDVLALYEFTLSAIRASRNAELDDEPGLSLAQIKEFVGCVFEAQVQSIQVESFHPSVERFSGCSAAVVITKVRYNRRSGLNTFRCIWVYSGGTWFTTALGKLFFGAPAGKDTGAS